MADLYQGPYVSCACGAGYRVNPSDPKNEVWSDGKGVLHARGMCRAAGWLPPGWVPQQAQVTLPMPDKAFALAQYDKDKAAGITSTQCACGNCELGSAMSYTHGWKQGDWRHFPRSVNVPCWLESKEAIMACKPSTDTAGPQSLSSLEALQSTYRQQVPNPGEPRAKYEDMLSLSAERALEIRRLTAKVEELEAARRQSIESDHQKWLDRNPPIDQRGMTTQAVKGPKLGEHDRWMEMRKAEAGPGLAARKLLTPKQQAAAAMSTWAGEWDLLPDAG